MTIRYNDRLTISEEWPLIFLFAANRNSLVRALDDGDVSVAGDLDLETQWAIDFL
jgi:hypothetical protein